MKHAILLSICTLVVALHAAEPPASFVWQGRTIPVAQLEKVDATRARLPDGTVIPISAVPPLLRSGIAPVPPPGRLFPSLRVIQILSHGLLMSPGPDQEPILLRLPEAPDRKTGLQPDQTTSCYATTDGQYTYVTTTGAEKTVDAYKWTGRPQAAPPPPQLLPGSKITGSSLDRK